MSKVDERDAEARRKAQALWSKDKQRDAAAVGVREKARIAEASKTARLRALRLAKEASDQEASEKAAVEKTEKAKAAKSVKRKVKTAAASG